MQTPTLDKVRELALDYLDEMGVEVKVTNEGLETERGVFGLEPLRCRLAERDEGAWVAMVQAHFEGLLSLEPVIPDSYDEAKPLLRSAVIPEMAMGMFDGALVERKLTDGLGERIMIRHGSMGMTVTREVVESWAVELDDVWEQARQGSLWDEPVVCDVFVRDAITYTAIRGGMWTSCRVLHLDKVTDPRLTYGTVTVVAARDEVLYHQISDERFAEASLAMVEHAAEGYMTAPYPVGCDLHWWFDGELHRIGTVDAGGYRYRRVPQFSATLRRLEGDLKKNNEV